MDKKKSFQALAEMDLSERRETLIDCFSKWADVGDSYIFDLTRVKEAFSVGTMGLEDFQEWDEKRITLLLDELLKTFPEDIEKAAPGWISVAERLPEAPYGCLVIVDDCEPMTGIEFLNILPYVVGWDGDRWNDGDGEPCPFEVRYWMPLPKIPEEAQSCRN